ncbi:hypothetical protein D3C79_549440 [compost metagenome]
MGGCIEVAERPSKVIPYADQQYQQCKAKHQRKQCRQPVACPVQILVAPQAKRDRQQDAEEPGRAQRNHYGNQLTGQRQPTCQFGNRCVVEHIGGVAHKDERPQHGKNCRQAALNADRLFLARRQGPIGA